MYIEFDNKEIYLLILFIGSKLVNVLYLLERLLFCVYFTNVHA